MNNVKYKFNKNFFEKDAWQESCYVCGIDEVGRGCLAGPLVTSTVILPQNTSYRLLKDSKTMTEEEREQAFHWITKNCIYSTAITSHRIIDKLNIYQSTLLTMKKSLLQILQNIPYDHNKIKYVLIDAMPVSLNKLDFYKNINIKFFDKGESRSSTIAAASIVAKVTRDRLMKKISEIFPQFNFSENKGYGTADHLKSLNTVGSSIIHRTSFITKIEKPLNEVTFQQQLF
jgi:ribonuclease HII